jgi:hypothetical protein
VQHNAQGQVAMELGIFQIETRRLHWKCTREFIFAQIADLFIHNQQGRGGTSDVTRVPIK